MKNKNVFAALALVGVLFMTGCPPTQEEHTDPSFLIGTWSNATATFTIASDYNFVCDLVNINILPPHTPVQPARVYGKLDCSGSGIGPNDYYMRDMRAGGAGDPDATYTDGNAALETGLATFANLVGTLTPNANKTEFTFTSTDAKASGFFGGSGAYIRQAD